MKFNEINSLEELQNSLSESTKTYVLLYKKGSELSECALNHIEAVSEDFDKLSLFSVDVGKVRDIHGKYNVKTVPTLLIFEGRNFVNTNKGCNTSEYYKSLFESSLYYSKGGDSENPQKSVTVYSTPTCSWCNTLKNHLRKHRIHFTDIDISSDPSLAEELVRKSGQQGVPQTEIDGEIIVGFDKTRINKLLGISG
jgi:glutaredoxin-like YruB-family protein